MMLRRRTVAAMEQGFKVVEDGDGVGKGLPERRRSRQDWVCGVT
jgi:hypothetical protein